MADKVEMQDIRGLKIDKVAKGYAETTYKWKSLVTISSTDADTIRWYQRTAAHLTATAPSYVQNISPLSTFPTLEVSWTRNTSYVKKYGAEGFISMEDIKFADLSVLATTIEQLTYSVIKKVDTDIYTVISDTYGTGSAGVNTVTSNAGWDAASGQDPIEDILDMVLQIETYDYDTSNAVLVLSPTDYKSLMSWLISTKGSNIPAFASDLARNGTLRSILGIRIVLDRNITSDYAVMVIPQRCGTWHSAMPTTARTIEEVGLGTKIRVWEEGIATLTDPRAVCVLSNTVD